MNEALAALELIENKPRRQIEELNEGWMVSYADLITLLFIFFSVMLSISVISKAKFELLTHQFNQTSASSLTNLKKRIDAEIQLQKLESQVVTAISDEGLQVQFSEGVLFQSGEAGINETGAKVLKQFAHTLSGVEQGFHLAVEGHTDSRPIHTAAFSSNWALSSARAVNVLHYFASRGVEEKKMMVRAYADTRPIANTEGQGTSSSQNRRVTILVY